MKVSDRVDRNVLLQHLADHGCGNRFLQSIGNTLKHTSSILGSEQFNATMGVRQGGPTSCSLFIFYINCTIQDLKHFGKEGLLGNLHSLLLMDDSTILATSRINMSKKLSPLAESCHQINSNIHPIKSRFMTVNTNDREPFILQNVVISYTQEYTFIGSQVSNSKLSKQVSSQVDSKHCHVRKFTSFICKNEDVPYIVKKGSMGKCPPGCYSLQL